ncbi:MAG TPA: type II secretion system protein [Burkholderiales bacterium]|nr:type II secretion system protein [Burkholderiales bacterium]
MNTMPTCSRQGAGGFTLVEAIVVIVLTGILASMAAVFIAPPIKAYFDVSNRAELTDIADTALRRAARDIRAALPNSIRLGSTGACDGTSTCYLEYVPIKSAGRYREAVTGGTPAGDILDFNSASDTTFDVLGPGVDVQSGDSIVVYNLGIPGADAYAGANRRAVPAGGVGIGLATVTFTSQASPFPFASPARRFQVVGTPVSYVCNGAGQLQRYSGYAFATSQPQPPSGTPAVVAINVSRCRFAYQSLNQLNAIVTLELGLTRKGESVSLIHQIHVNNVP